MAKNTDFTHEQPSLTQIQRYLNGEMSAEEMHNFEMQALENPMLAEAIEGLEMVKTKSQNLVEIELQKRLKNRIQASRKRIFSLQNKMIGIAASILLLVCATFIFRFYENLDTKKEILSENKTLENPAAEQKKTENLADVEATEKKSDSEKMVNIPSNKDKKEVFIEKKQDLAVNENLKKDVSPNYSSEEKTEAVTADEQNQGISEEKNMEDEAVAVRSFNEKNEMADISHLKRKKNAMESNISKNKNEPKPLKNDFDIYLQDSLRYPNTNLEGVVELEFLVDKKGKLSDIQVIKSLSADCDAEAIRLLKAGGDWKLIKKKQRKARISVNFKHSK